MGYKVLGRTEELLQGYTARKGLEGPFIMGGYILYYDGSEGKYWNPKTDFYVEHAEMDLINTQLMDMLKA